MKAIETEYKGYRFRSRLEARWAVFFDACGVKWEYEPEGFDLGDGLYYLPDFLLHDVFLREVRKDEAPIDLWIEVKGQMTDEDAKKIRKFYEAGLTQSKYTEISKTAILVVGKIPESDNVFSLRDELFNMAYDDHHGVLFYNFYTIDGDYFGAIPGVDEKGRFVLFGDAPCYWRDANGADKDATINAYRMARQARFEHNDNINFATSITNPRKSFANG